MPRRPELQATLTTQGWAVSIPASLSPTGERTRKFFGESKAKAEKFALGLRKSYHAGERRTLLAPEDALQAVEALKILAPAGITLMEAARAAVARWEASKSTETFRERWLAYTAKMEPHWRQRYADDMAKIPRWVPASFMKLRLHEITPGAVEDALRKGGAKAEGTIKARATRINAVISGRGGKRRAKGIAILDRRQLALLKWRSRKDPETRRAIGLLLFAGIRPGAQDGEISRLDWSAVGASEIYIDHDTSKTGSDRHIPLGRRLRWWIRGHPPEGLVAPAWWKVKWQAIRKEAGLGSGQDLTRHTFASHFLAVHGEKATKQALGHTEGSDTLFRHYRKAVTERDGKRYFGER